MEVFFYGLMCFIAASRSGPVTFVALVQSNVHEAEVVVDGVEIGLRRGDVISFDVGSGNATPDALFDTVVPHLQDLTSKDGGRANLKSNVHDMKPTRVVHAYVMMPAGVLSVAKVYEHQARFTKVPTGPFENCVSEMIVLKPTTRIKSVTIHHVSGTQEIQNVSNWVLITNFYHGPSNAGDYHFDLHAHLTDATSKADMTERGDKCMAPVVNTRYLGEVEAFIGRRTPVARRIAKRIHRLSPTQVECAPSQFP